MVVTAAAGVYHSPMPENTSPDFQIVERPDLYVELHRPFALRTRDRLAARFLLALLRLPIGARLLRRWHSKRSA
jgi:hypothetical protein